MNCEKIELIPIIQVLKFENMTQSPVPLLIYQRNIKAHVTSALLINKYISLNLKWCLYLK